VFPYCTEDLSVANRLVDAGCKVVMPWAAPIGSAKGITNRDALKLLRDRLPDITLVVDAGIGAPSHAAEALELGYDAVLLNTAIANAADPTAMANAFRLGVEAGRAAYEAGLMEARDFASPSTPVVGTPFWHAVSCPLLSHRGQRRLGGAADETWRRHDPVASQESGRCGCACDRARGAGRDQGDADQTRGQRL